VVSKGMNMWAKGHTVKREPAENTAGLEATLHFVNPVIVISHPCRALAGNIARLGCFPESRSSEVLVGPNGVGTELAP